MKNDTFVLSIFLLVAGCSDAKFAAPGGARLNRNDQSQGDQNSRGLDPNQTGNQNDIGSIGGGDGSSQGPGGLGGPGGIGIDNGVIGAPNPQPCQTGQGKVITSGMCEASHTIYTVDDGGTAKFGCCPLPLPDILLTTPPVVRTNICADGEVLVGISSGSSYYCQGINSAKYRLAPAQKACYYGSGSSGRGSASKCSGPIPPSIEKIVKDVMGSDGCIAVPYGALAISRQGKNCSDIEGRQLLFNDSGQPVPMVPATP